MKRSFRVTVKWTEHHPNGPNDLQQAPIIKHIVIHVKARDWYAAGEEAMFQESRKQGVAMEAIDVEETVAE
jgi:hypothetical protein